MRASVPPPMTRSCLRPCGHGSCTYLGTKLGRGLGGRLLGFLVEYPVILPEDDVSEHGEDKRRPHRDVDEHEREAQDQDEHAHQPVGRRISPISPDAVEEEAAVQRGAENAAGDEQHPELAVAADIARAATV